MSPFNTAVFIDHVLGQIASFNNIVALKYTTGYFADPASPICLCLRFCFDLRVFFTQLSSLDLRV